MICINLKANANKFFCIYNKCRGYATYSFSKGATCPAVQQSIRLQRAFVDGHGAADEILAQLGHHDAEMLDRATGVGAIDLVHRRTTAERSGHGGV